ncbi:hypothetical protein EHP00_193 [Ecytonucleospora hepatopenaei]|uniref:Uncharacterized protein n=1 Tax=Ecytonucleospora hepatopenaei TaxID=646526 RepID=A0A1W0E6I7_9MICR|nr:hypothetical protein EHP00_193 [Ecytonucleospora hepatopenaei]
MNKKTELGVNIVLYAFVFYFNCVLLFLWTCKNISVFSNGFINIFLFIELIFNFIYRAKLRKANWIRSSGIIFLIFIITAPVIKNIVRHIDLDTIIFMCIISSVIYATETSKHHVLMLKTNKKLFTREQPIPIEHALLIPCNFKHKNTIGNVATTFLLINIVSRVNEDYEVLFILKIGCLVLYIFPLILVYKQLRFNIYHIIVHSFLCGILFFCTYHLVYFSVTLITMFLLCLVSMNLRNF